MEEISNAINYIIKLIQKIDSAAKVIVTEPESYKYYFSIEVRGKKNVIIFTRAIIEDFEIALKKYAGTSYYDSIENAVKFQVYISLGQEGFIPDFSISTEILNEKRGWSEDVRFNVVFNEDFCRILNEGLKKLSEFLGDTIAKHKDLALPTLIEDKEYVDSLLEYYEKNHSFTSKGASVKSSGYLKTAALCEIINEENKKKDEELINVRKAIDKKIYSTVSTLRKAPFLEISLPECAYEYATHHKSRLSRNVVSKQSQIDSGRIPRLKTEEDVSIIKWDIKKEEFIPPFKPDLKRLYDCFVIMPMGEEGAEERKLNDAIFYYIIKPCVEKSGFNITCSHAGLIGDSGSIPAQIIKKLYNSDIVLADLRGFNPNVIWELGVRHAFLKRSIMVCSNVEELDRFFDISVFRVIPYSIDGRSNQDFFKNVCSYIQAIIANPTKSDNPVWDHRPVKYKTPSIYSMKASPDDNKTTYQPYYQGGNHMKINFSIMLDNESPEKNYIMEREFLLLNLKKELIGKLNVAGETLQVNSNEDLGIVTKVFPKGLMLDEDSPLFCDFEASIYLDKIKQKTNIKEKDELYLNCNFTPRNGSSFSGGMVRFPVIFSK